MPSAECRETTRTAPEAIKRQGWREEGILVIDVNDIRLNWTERELVKNLGEKLYGKREVI